MPQPRRVPEPALASFIAAALHAVGLPAADAAKVAALMAAADVAGSDGHGVFRLPHYIRRIEDGGVNTSPNIRVIRETDAAALVDGDNGMGHLAVSRAVELAIAKARAKGVAWVGTRNSNHAGPAGLYARMPLAHDMIGIYVAVGSANHLPPWGGLAMLLSTNPIAIAVPALTRPPVVLDMATTNAAYGKVKIAAQRGETMPEGWMVDREGRPLTDPARAGEGFLLPIGGAKGYGLALMFGLLAGTLNGAAFGADVVDFNADTSSLTNTGQLIIVADIAAFAEPTAFKRQVDTLYDQIKDSPLMPGFDEIRLPGESAARIQADRTAHGVPIPPPLGKALDDLADRLRIARLPACLTD